MGMCQGDVNMEMSSGNVMNMAMSAGKCNDHAYSVWIQVSVNLAFSGHVGWRDPPCAQRRIKACLLLKTTLVLRSSLPILVTLWPLVSFRTEFPELSLCPGQIKYLRSSRQHKQRVSMQLRWRRCRMQKTSPGGNQVISSLCSETFYTSRSRREFMTPKMSL